MPPTLTGLRAIILFVAIALLLVTSACALTTFLVTRVGDCWDMHMRVIRQTNN